MNELDVILNDIDDVVVDAAVYVDALKHNGATHKQAVWQLLCEYDDVMLENGISEEWRFTIIEIVADELYSHYHHDTH